MSEVAPIVKCSIPIVCIAFVVLCIGVTTAESADVDFNFSGSISYLDADYNTFGGNWTPGTPVTGHVIYDPTAAATDPSSTCDCMGYRQQIAGGFAIMVGDTLLRADDYMIQVQNDLVDQFTGRTHDQLTVLWSSSINPKLPSPLWANGVPYTTHWLD